MRFRLHKRCFSFSANPVWPAFTGKTRYCSGVINTLADCCLIFFSQVVIFYSCRDLIVLISQIYFLTKVSMPVMKRIFTLIFIVFITFDLKAQNPVGIAQLVNFSKLNYKGGNQNWDIQQDSQGVMYFANNEGLLTYNGESWKIYQTPNKTVVRSVQIDTDGKIYIGAQDEIGYFYPDGRGVLKYTSLKSLIPPVSRSFNDVWKVVIGNGKVFFRSTREIFVLDKGKISSYSSYPGWLFMGRAGGRMFAQENITELVEFRENSWKPVCRFPGQTIITAITAYSKDTLLVATLKDGLYLLVNHQLIRKKTGLDNVFSSIRVNTLEQINDRLYAIGSGFNGCYVMDHDGRVIQSYSDKESLQKNNVRSLFLDQNKNIWLGLDDGISFIAYNNAIKQIYTDINRQPSTYSVHVFNRQLYIGTSDAVFYLPLSAKITDLSMNTGIFKEIPDTKGQVWNLSEVNNHLLLGNEDGAFEITGNSLKEIFTFPGTWLFKNLDPGRDSAPVLAGTYEGIRLLNYKDGSFRPQVHYPGITESLRFLSIDYARNTVWASHPYKGVYRMELSPDRQKILSQVLYTRQDGLPGTLHNYVYKIKGRNIVATEKGIYEFDYTKNRFFLSPFFEPLFGQQELQYLNEDKDGNIWFIGNKRVGVIDFSKQSAGKTFTTVYFPELTAKVLAGFENIYPYDKQNIFVGSSKGVFHINYEQYLKNTSRINVILGQVRATGDRDSLVFGGYFTHNGLIQNAQARDAVLEFSSTFNSFNFEFSSTLFEQHSNIEYSYRLEGFDDKWSAWNARNEKDYTNLGSGTYTFRVKARNNLGSESPAITYTFVIRPAWYLTWYSLSFYTLVVLVSLYLFYQVQQQKHQRKEADLIYVHKLELEHIENEVTSLKNEKLETEVNHKNKELATATMHLVQRGKLLSQIKDGLLPLTKEEGAGSSQAELLKVLKLINEAERNDSDWDSFAIHFDQIHSDYLKQLKAKFPDLTATDLKMCAYLKINLTSKEIAQLMSITIRSVEVSRYRLRKKLNIESSMNLFDFLVKETSGEQQQYLLTGKIPAEVH